MIRIAGHFGEWLQGRLGQDGPLVLVTLGCPALTVTAARLESRACGVIQSPPVLSSQRIDRLFDLLGLPKAEYRLEAGMPPGGGAGASTAALVALARAAGHDDAAELADACLAVEGASDPLMLPYPDRVLWAPRQAKVIAPLPAPPQAVIIGGFWGDPQRTDPRDLAFPEVSDLVARWHAGPDLVEVARIASESARRCSRMRGPAADPTEDLAQRLGALGHVRAHTGSARGLIFAPDAVPEGIAPALRAAGYSRILRFDTGAAA
ncbi:propanediol utilization protein [Paracoccus ravus]|uniref:propanediol utilization protein n=1 Tax=Paracoccus ravus TaxID=2447760 RepID=UPI00106E0A84|nr:propanediol utilization protein [Paracoccus ravus]